MKISDEEYGKGVLNCDFPKNTELSHILKYT